MKIILLLIFIKWLLNFLNFHTQQADSFWIVSEDILMTNPTFTSSYLFIESINTGSPCISFISFLQFFLRSLVRSHLDIAV